MAGIPQNFQAISNVLPTYNFVDIISGTGYVNFYAGTTVDLKPLSNFTYYSDSILDSAVLPAASANALYFDHDYDVLLNRPMDIKGLGILNVPIYEHQPNGNGSGYVVAYIRKWNGAVETDIVTNTSRTVSGADNYEMLGIDMDIPLTHFKIGETLRITIMLYGANSHALNVGTIRYAHDPKNRTDGWDTTGAVPSQLVFQCPVRLNL